MNGKAQALADQKFLKAAAISTEADSRTNWQVWRDEDIAKVRGQLAESMRLHYVFARQREKQRQRIHMWQLAAFAGWFIAFLIGMEGKW